MISRFNLIPVFAVLAFSALTLPSSFAGAGSGGGGNAVVCFDDSSIPERIRQERGNSYLADTDIPHITKVEILDLYQAKESGKKLIEAKPGETIDQYTDRLLGRFTDLVPSIPQYVDEGAKALAAHVPFPDGLDAIEDVGVGENVNTPECVRITIIGQYDREGGLIGYDPRIFNLPDTVFSTTSKALSWLHEKLYWIARQHGASTSDSTRELVGAMITEEEMILDLESKLYPVVGGYAGDFITKLASDYRTDLVNSHIIAAPDSRHNDYSQKGWDLFGFMEDCTKKADAKVLDPALALYNRTWRPKLFAFKQVPVKTLQIIDSLFQTPFLDIEIHDPGNFPLRSHCEVQLHDDWRLGSVLFTYGSYGHYDLNFPLPQL